MLNSDIFISIIKFVLFLQIENKSDMGKIQNKQEQSKRLVENTILKNIPKDQVSWIRQPVTLTFMRGDFERIQLIFMASIMERMQDRVNDWLGMGKEKQALQPSLFSKEEIAHGMDFVRIPLSSFGIASGHYDQLDEAAELMSGMRYKHDTVNDKGLPVTDYIPLFEKIRIPRRPVFKDGEQLFKKDKDGNLLRDENGKPVPVEHRESYVEFKINKGAMESAFNMKQYNRYLKDAALNCKSRFTARIYLCLTAYKFSRQKTWTVSYKDLRLMLGADGEFDEKKKPIVKYPIYTDFRKRVLNDSRKELMDLAEKGMVDCYFDYEEIFPGGKRRGNPDKIIFKIFLSEMGKEDQRRISSNIHAGKIVSILSEEFNFSSEEISGIMKRISPEFSEIVKSFLEDISRTISKREDISNKKGYIMASLKSKLSQLEEEFAQPVITTVDTSPEFEFQEAEAVEVMHDERWDSFLADMKMGMEEDLFDCWIKPLELDSLKDGNIYIKSPSSFVTEQIEEKFADLFMKNLRKHFSKDITVFFV